MRAGGGQGTAPAGNRGGGRAPGGGDEGPSQTGPPAAGRDSKPPARALRTLTLWPRVRAAAAKPQYPGRARCAGKGGRKLQLPGGSAGEGVARRGPIGTKGRARAVGPRGWGRAGAGLRKARSGLIGWRAGAGPRRARSGRTSWGAPGALEGARPGGCHGRNWRRLPEGERDGGAGGRAAGRRGRAAGAAARPHVGLTFPESRPLPSAGGVLHPSRWRPSRQPGLRQEGGCAETGRGRGVRSDRSPGPTTALTARAPRDPAGLALNQVARSGSTRLAGGHAACRFSSFPLARCLSRGPVLRVPPEQG